MADTAAKAVDTKPVKPAAEPAPVASDDDHGHCGYGYGYW